MDLGDCGTYSALVVGVTSVWVYIGRQWSFSMLANAMYFPTLFTLLFVQNFSEFFMQVFGVNELLNSVIYSVIAVVMVHGIIWACVGLDILTGWGKWLKIEGGSGYHGPNSLQLSGLLRAAGEEIGWRCYLLPCLMNSLTPFSALLFSGVVWGLFHVAVMILLVRRIHPPKPYLTVFIQCLSVTICAFPNGWLAMKAGYSIWPSTLMHYVWNRVNPQILGSIYTHEVGLLSGQQWLINGEGLAGCIVMTPLALLVLWNLY